jgi:hypothetical protein
VLAASIVGHYATPDLSMMELLQSLISTERATPLVLAFASARIGQIVPSPELNFFEKLYS